jgi:hypothetical protein
MSVQNIGFVVDLPLRISHNSPEYRGEIASKEIGELRLNGVFLIAESFCQILYRLFVN